MHLLLLIVIFSLVGGVLSVIAASLFLLLPERHRVGSLPHFVSLATGAMLGAAFLGLIPNAVSGENALGFHQLGLTILLGIMGFFILEKMVLWRHCHDEGCEAHTVSDHHHQHSAAGTLVLIGDGVHNLVDGVLIAAAFLTDVHLGIITSLAVAAHEIPQEVGDFVLLLHSGYSRGRALFFNILSSLTTIIGAVVTYYSLQNSLALVPYFIAVAAASFIYIAVADLIPTLHKRIEFKETIRQIVLITLGVLIIVAAHELLH
ncbi:MAG: ZIP family metal transporter [Gammaproteobacteria bacterium]|nr:ZIP family metal transporter [Gammaproteobacteria bacterium]